MSIRERFAASLTSEEAQAFFESHPDAVRLAAALNFAGEENEEGLNIDTALGDTDTVREFIDSAIASSLRSSKLIDLSPVDTLTMLFAQGMSIGYALAAVDYEDGKL